MLTLNMTKIVQHIWEAIRFENTRALWSRSSTASTPSAPPATCAPGTPASRASGRSNRTSTSASSTAPGRQARLSLWTDDPHVAAWVKNDHLGFEVLYVYKGVVRKYRPDFLIRLANGTMLVLEVKGQDTQQDQAKREFLDEWVEAVNAHGGFGEWAWEVSFQPEDVHDVLAHYCEVKKG